MQEITLRHGESEHMTVHHYPDGQKNITLKMETLNVKLRVIIKCSIRNFSELEILLCLVAALRKNDFYIHEINFIYLFGMRSDRAFEVGMPNYFRDVVAPIINSLNIPRINVYHPHSLSGFLCLNNSLGHFGSLQELQELQMFNTVIIWGDESSSCHFSEFSPYLFNKTRINNVPNIEMDDVLLQDIGKLSQQGRSFIICDDLVDGGATFIEEAKYLRERFPEIKLHLYVTHAIFSKGIHIVADHFDSIICTNSYQDISHPKVQQIKVI